MANPEFGIGIGGATLWVIEIDLGDRDLGDRDRTQATRGEIKIKDFAPNTEELFELFSESFLSTPGVYFSTLKSGVASYEEVRFILEQMSGGVWNYTQRYVPPEFGPEFGEVKLPQGAML